ncbi:MAG: ATP-binding protein [Micromonosporaceae bacterium]
METIDTPAALGRELKRWIRDGAGRPMKVPTLARRLNISQSSLYAYLAGTTVPPADTLDDLLRQLAVPDAEQRRLATARDDLQERRDKPVVSPPPRELPPDPAGFVGRSAECAELGTALRRASTDAAAPAVVTISGPAGIGKTALVEHWSHQMADEFPDGCLYTDLRGYSPGEPRLPGDVLAGFLRALGVHSGNLPDDPDERAAWYRSALAGRRVLVVLDNAYDSEQVRPLLPGTGSCFVMVTSRNDLAGLSIRPGAHRISLDALPEPDQWELLRTHIGSRVNDDPAAARELAGRCTGLPLALRIVSAHAARRPDQALAALAADLSVANGLDQFDLGEPGTAVRTVFSWSEKHLPPQAAEDFRLLGVAPLAEWEPNAVAALLGTTPASARRRLDVLVRHHLVLHRAGGRYGMHDLVRTYAVELSVEIGHRDTAVTRLLDHYVTATKRAIALLHPRDAGPEGDNEATAPFDDPAMARSWLDAEWPNLLPLAAFSAHHGWPGHTIQLAAPLRRHFDESGLHSDAMTLLGHALHASRAIGDRGEEGMTLCNLGVAHMRLGRLDEATEHQQRALELCRSTGDQYSEAGVLNNLGNLMERLGRYDEAITYYQQARVLAQNLGLRHGDATLLNNMGYVALRQARYDAATDHCERSLELFQTLGDVGGAARAHVNLGAIAHQLHRYDEALERYQGALSRSREIGARGIGVEALNGVGETYRALGDLDQARASHEAALDAARQSADPYYEALSVEGLGHTAAAAAEPEDAARYWDTALAIYRRLRVPEADRLQAQLP